jgi:hypothetical protein
MAETLAPGTQASAIIRYLAASDHIRRERAGRASSNWYVLYSDIGLDIGSDCIDLTRHKKYRSSQIKSSSATRGTLDAYD